MDYKHAHPLENFTASREGPVERGTGRTVQIERREKAGVVAGRSRP